MSMDFMSIFALTKLCTIIEEEHYIPAMYYMFDLANISIVYYNDV